MEYRKHRTIKAETVHIRSKRADRNAAVVKKWYVQESDHRCREHSVALANSLPVDGQQYDRHMGKRLFGAGGRHFALGR